MAETHSPQKLFNMERREQKQFNPKQAEQLRKEVEASMHKQRMELRVKQWPKRAFPNNNGRRIS